MNKYLKAFNKNIYILNDYYDNMIKSYNCNPNWTVHDYDIHSEYDMLKGYTIFYEVYDRIELEYKIEMLIAKCKVWNIEINSIKMLLESTIINEIEKLLLEDHKNMLQNEAWECREELYQVYHGELSQSNPHAEVFLEKIENVCICLEEPVTKRNIDFDKYIKLSHAEKIKLRIAQSRMLDMEIFALVRRQKSLVIDIFENMFLNYRIDFLQSCITHNDRYIRRIFFENISRDSPEVNKIFEEIMKADISIAIITYTWECKYNLERFRYPYDFERPNNVSPIEWGDPTVYWKTGTSI